MRSAVIGVQQSLRTTSREDPPGALSRALVEGRRPGGRYDQWPFGSPVWRLAAAQHRTWARARPSLQRHRARSAGVYDGIATSLRVVSGGFPGDEVIHLPARW